MREHQGGLAVPPADQGKAVVPPLVFRPGGRGGPGRAPASSPAAAPTSTSSWPTAIRKTVELQVDRGPGLAAGGRGCERGGGGGQRAIPAPLTPWAGSPRCPSGPLASAAPRGGGRGEGGGRAGGGGGEVPRPPCWSRPAPGGAAVPREKHVNTA